MLNTGITTVSVTEEELAHFYNNPLEFKLDMQLFPYANHYLFFELNGVIVDKQRWDGEKFVQINRNSFPGQRLNSKMVKPLNEEQEALFDLLQNDNITVKQITGIAGSGKNFCSMAYALMHVDRTAKRNQGKYRKIVLIRNNIEVKDSRPLGALPSGINEKLLPYAMPFADILGSELELMRMIEDEKIELVHLGFVRGRNFDNSIIIADEAENLTADHVALLVSRVGKNSVILFLGDEKQVDKKVFEDNSGLTRLNVCLSGQQLYGCVNLVKAERSETSQLAQLLY